MTEPSSLQKTTVAIAETERTHVDPVIQALGPQLREAIGNRLDALWLFGSRARGDASPDSDYDLLVVVDEVSSVVEERILDLQVELLDRYDALVGVLLRTTQQWRDAQGFPLAENIRREGIQL
jgi:predicted nucleotidyltransferase